MCVIPYWNVYHKKNDLFFIIIYVWLINIMCNNRRWKMMWFPLFFIKICLVFFIKVMWWTIFMILVLWFIMTHISCSHFTVNDEVERFFSERNDQRWRKQARWSLFYKSILWHLICLNLSGFSLTFRYLVCPWGFDSPKEPQEALRTLRTTLRMHFKTLNDA